jgi:hypothetical protein
MKESLDLEKWREEELKLGLMAVDMRVTLREVRKTVKAHFIGLMDRNMLEAGGMESNMD